MGSDFLDTLYFWQSIDAILEEVSVAEIISLMLIIKRLPSFTN